MNEPDKITLNRCDTLEIAATSATAMVVISGDSLVFGNEALQKARAVSRFVGALKAKGVGEKTISIVSVSANSASGVFTRSTTARYVLRVESIPLEKIPAFIDSISDQKDIALNTLKWNYPDLESGKDLLLGSSIEKLKAKGAQVARSLGVNIIGIHSMKEEYLEPDAGGGDTLMDTALTRGIRAGRAAVSDFGLDFSHSGTLSLRLSITFRISEIGKA